MIQAAPLTVVFYKTANGAVPVREWLRDMDREDRAAFFI